MSLNVELLEDSFALVRPNADRFAADFYDRLFAAHPGTRQLFAGADMAEQRKKLMDSLVLVIENLENPGVLTGALQRLGARHSGYGVAEGHYAMVGGALLDTFSEHLGSEWTPEVKQAWSDAYTAISGIMVRGAPPAAS
jgi:hemoglobin-like flavoprotein